MYPDKNANKMISLASNCNDKLLAIHANQIVHQFSGTICKCLKDDNTINKERGFSRGAFCYGTRFKGSDLISAGTQRHKMLIFGYISVATPGDQNSIFNVNVNLMSNTDVS